MENTDSLAKQSALDNKSAYAGNVNPNPDLASVNKLAEQADISVSEEEVLEVKATLDQRDENRWELNPNSMGNSTITD